MIVHKGRINSIVYLKDKSYLASSSYDTSIIFWKTVTNITEINQLTGHLRQTEKVIQLSNSNYLVSASDDFTLKVWDQFTNIATLKGHKNNVYSLVEISNNRMASCSKDKSIII